LIPFDETQSRILLVNKMAPAHKFLGFHSLAVFVAGLLGVAIWARG
jgi:hypothetical protein